MKIKIKQKNNKKNDKKKTKKTATTVISQLKKNKNPQNNFIQTELSNS